MTTIPHNELLDFLCLDLDFKFSYMDNTFSHSLLNTKIDLLHYDKGTVNFNKTITKFNCLNIIAYQDSKNEDTLYIFLFHDIAQNGLHYKQKEIQSDVKNIKDHIKNNYPNYKFLKISIIKYVTKAQKSSTFTERCKKEFKIKQNGIIDLSGYCIYISSIKFNSKLFKL